jgi:high-affinity Fe2+/Pb2+ permease
MTDRKQKFWFHAKLFGFGWGMPASWQGWVVLVLYLVLVIAAALFAPTETRLPVIFLLTAMFIIVVVFTGERPAKWRWGKD